MGGRRNDYDEEVQEVVSEMKMSRITQVMIIVLVATFRLLVFVAYRSLRRLFGNYTWKE